MFVLACTVAMYAAAAFVCYAGRGGNGKTARAAGRGQQMQGHQENDVEGMELQSNVSAGLPAAPEPAMPPGAEESAAWQQLLEVKARLAEAEQRAEEQRRQLEKQLDKKDRELQEEKGRRLEEAVDLQQGETDRRLREQGHLLEEQHLEIAALRRVSNSGAKQNTVWA